MFSKFPLEIINTIFGYLKEESKLELALVSEQLGCAFAYHVGGRYKGLDGINFKHERHLKVILEFCGSTVVDIQIRFKFKGNASLMDVIFKLIAKHCVNLETASVNITPLTFNASKYVLAMKGLKTIKLDFNIEDYEESDLIQYINPDCKVLSVENISDYQAENLRQLINLEELLVRWPNDKLRNIFQIVSNLKTLRNLYLGCCTQDPFQKENIEFSELEELELLGCEIHTVLPKCPKLKFFRLHFSLKKFSCNILDTIARCASTLEHLDIIITDYDRNTFSGEQFIKALGKCKRLRRLAASFDLLEVLFFEFQQSFIALLRENGFNKERRLKLDFIVRYCPVMYRKFENETANSEVWNLITLQYVI